MVKIQISPTQYTTLDLEDSKHLPTGHEFIVDKDGYCLMRWYSQELRKHVSARLHRWVMHEPKGLMVDHVDGDRLNNSKVNLRLATAQQNGANRKKNYRNGTATSQYKGVYRQKTNQKWHAAIRVKSKAKYLGSFLTEQEAALAYNQAAKELWGDFARLNSLS